MPNPFLDDIATDPRRMGASVPGLNDRALDTVVEVFEGMVTMPLPRLHQPAPKAQLVLSVEPGYGKSHLIGRLFERLRGRATLVYLRPFVKAETCWSSLLRRTVQELEYPDTSPSSNGEANPEYTQLDALACGVLAHLVANLIQRGKLKAQDPVGSMSYLQTQPLDAFGLGHQQHGWADWLRVVIPQSYEAMGSELVRMGLSPRVPSLAAGPVHLRDDAGQSGPAQCVHGLDCCRADRRRGASAHWTDERGSGPGGGR